MGIGLGKDANDIPAMEAQAAHLLHSGRHNASAPEFPPQPVAQLGGAAVYVCPSGQGNAAHCLPVHRDGSEDSLSLIRRHTALDKLPCIGQVIGGRKYVPEIGRHLGVICVPGNGGGVLRTPFPKLKAHRHSSQGSL